jgi:hypothetical protein
MQILRQEVDETFWQASCMWAAAATWAVGATMPDLQPSPVGSTLLCAVPCGVWQDALKSMPYPLCKSALLFKALQAVIPGMNEGTIADNAGREANTTVDEAIQVSALSSQM